MKLKSILLTAVATISYVTVTMAQVPNYVPTNGLVGWWPFNGNANDESGNGNNGTVNGATLTTDRYGITNKCYNFYTSSGGGGFIQLSSITLGNYFTISTWINLGAFTPGNVSSIISKYSGSMGYELNIDHANLTPGGRGIFGILGPESVSANSVISNYPFGLGSWGHIVWVKDNTNSYLYLNDSLIYQKSNVNTTTTNSGNTFFGKAQWGGNNFRGKIDDIGIWNRALTQKEITDLYKSVKCANNTTITPQTNSKNSGSTATFTATTSDPNPSYVWQSDFGQGFQTLNNFGNYSGVNTATLNIANVQLPSHTQPIRVISTSGNCIDTSNVAVINILDTCLVTVYDTLLTTVTDTLVINAQITGINPPNNLNTLKVYPNPASSHITIDYGNFNTMRGYTLTIVNSIGQRVFTTPINQQTSYIDLSTWTGNGIYFVQLIDTQNNTIETRKIVIQ